MTIQDNPEAIELKFPSGIEAIVTRITDTEVAKCLGKLSAIEFASHSEWDDTKPDVVVKAIRATGLYEQLFKSGEEYPPLIAVGQHDVFGISHNVTADDDQEVLDEKLRSLLGEYRLFSPPIDIGETWFD